MNNTQFGALQKLNGGRLVELTYQESQALFRTGWIEQPSAYRITAAGVEALRQELIAREQDG